MLLTQFRKQFPEYDDIADDDLSLEFDFEPEEVDTITPAIDGLGETLGDKLEELCKIVRSIEIPNQSVDVLALLKQIKNGIGSLEVAIKKIDVNVTTAAPVVKVPAQVIQKLELPKPITEWNFDIVRDRNGFAQSVKATAA